MLSAVSACLFLAVAATALKLPDNEVFDAVMPKDPFHKFQKQTRCCFPKEFSSNVGFITGWSKTGTKLAGSNGGAGRYAFDYTGQATASALEVADLHGGWKIQYRSIQNYTLGLQCVIETIKGKPKCACAKLSGKMYRCLDGATFVGEYVMGYNDKQLPVQSWTIPLPKTYMSLSVTRPQGMCVPVGSIVLGSAKSVGYVTTSGVSAFLPRIKDSEKSMFEIPKICKKPEEQSDVDFKFPEVAKILSDITHRD